MGGTKLQIHVGVTKRTIYMYLYTSQSHVLCFIRIVLALLCCLHDTLVFKDWQCML